MTTPYSVAAVHPKTIWIDLDNSPHVLFFHPIIQELKRRGYRVVVTVRDFAQVVGLSELFHLEYTVIGRHYGKSKLSKTVGLLIRSIQMLPLLVKEKPDLALSHGSRSQLLISRVMGLPSIHAFDYEHATEIPFLRASYAIVPELIPEREALRKAKKFFRYPGIKEDVYSDRLVPDPGLLRTLGVDEKEVVVTVRPPATPRTWRFQESTNFQQWQSPANVPPTGPYRRSAALEPTPGSVKAGMRAFCIVSPIQSAAALGPVYSVNIVGYANFVFPVGQPSAFSFMFTQTDSKLNTLLPLPPEAEATTLMFFNPATPSYS